MSALKQLAALAAEIRTQDNACTADPIFMVQERVITYGMDPEYADDHQIVWLDVNAEYEECEPKLSRRLEKLYCYSWDATVGKKLKERYQRTAKAEHWQHVQPFLTKAAAEDWIKRNSHNYTKGLRVYVESAYRNAEWKLMRQAILELAPEGGAA